MNLARLVADLGEVLAGHSGDSPQVNWDQGGMAMLDIQGSRIVLGYSAGLDGKFAACLSVGVGYGPGSGTTALAERHDTVSRMIVDRIQCRLGSDGTVWHHSARNLTPDLLRVLIAELPRCGSVRLALELTRKADMAATRSAGAAALAATEAAILLPANDQPPALHPQLDELRRIRAALYAPTPHDKPVTLRLAAHAMNATLVAIATPVGAAVMTCSLLRGESLQASARLMAIVGLAVGATDMASAGDLMSLP